ncbi:LPS export ABC transporter permease LptG [Phaeovibrio sulfidiphilus]|uniref:LPS export ABC transporter permease LptG n=1 Tax=Phaeovibrio sulfidiphilus TaxID=1220600 RepID=A0A8J7CDL2_9PROT|nr:LPS export ABC transporter permease LptG [Phaeovibrio sulfidiphilus]MBE1237114.1 LPS export ABC transporter permease LptG [Phaeovibrio sulfidiphilus]
MRTFPTLTVYIARNYLGALAWVLLVVGGLLFLFDSIELIRRAGSREVRMETILAMALFHLPTLLQSTLSFVFMAAGLLCFWRFSRSSELVVFRGIGLSAWRFLAPVIGTVAVLSVLNVTVFNPVTAALYKRYERLEPVLEGGRVAPMAVSSGGFWLREVTPDGTVVTHARGARQEGRVLSLNDVTVFRFDPAGKFLERTDAQTAVLGHDELLLSNVIETRPGFAPERYENRSLPTDLTLPKIRESFSSPETISFWGLLSVIRFFEAAGFSANDHRLYFHSLLASPVLTLAMVLLGAVFSIGAAQRSANWLLRLSGATAVGFGVYVLERVTLALGRSETLPIALAVWAPAFIALFIALFFIFHIEDG